MQSINSSNPEQDPSRGSYIGGQTNVTLDTNPTLAGQHNPALTRGQTGGLDQAQIRPQQTSDEMMARLATGPDFEDTNEAGSDAGSLNDQQELIRDNVLKEELAPTKVTIENGYGLKSGGPAIRSFKDINDFKKHVEESYLGRLPHLIHRANALTFPTVSDPTFNHLETYNKSSIISTIPSSIDTIDNMVTKAVDLHVPVRFLVNSGDGLPLDDTELLYINDDAFLPLLYPDETGGTGIIAEIRGRPSLATYPSRVNPGSINKIGAVFDPTTVRAFQNAFQLKNEADAVWIVKNRVKTAEYGDNHLALLVRAFMYLFDSYYAQTPGTVPHRRGASPISKAYNIHRDTNWVQSIATNGQEIINCIGMPADYAQFWAYCCFGRNEIVAAKTLVNGTKVTSPFAQYSMRLSTKMAVLSDNTVDFGPQIPFWHGKPNIISGFIEMYAAKFGLDAQVNDAFAIASNIPTFYGTGSPLSIPEPLHSADWFDGQIDRNEVNMPFNYLIHSSPKAILLGLVGQVALVGATLYDIATLYIERRMSIMPRAEDQLKVSDAFTLLFRKPGALNRFVFNGILRNQPSLMLLVGWENTFVNMRRMVPDVIKGQSLWPLHLHYSQLFTARTSIRNLAPIYDEVFKPSIEEEYHCVSVGLNDYMVLKRIGMSNRNQGDTSWGALTTGVSSITVDNSYYHVPSKPDDRAYWRKVKMFGVSLELTPANPYVPETIDLMADPADSRATYALWHSAALNTPAFQAERGGFRNTESSGNETSTSVVNQDAFINATSTLDKVLKRAVKMVAIEESKRVLKVSRRCTNWEAVLEMNSGTISQQTLYNPEADGDCGWQCLATIYKAVKNEDVTVSELQRRAKGVIFWQSCPDSLTFYDVVEMVVKMDLNVGVINKLRHDSRLHHNATELVHHPIMWDVKFGVLQMELADNHWRIMGSREYLPVFENSKDMHHTNTVTKEARQLVNIDSSDANSWDEGQKSMRQRQLGLENALADYERASITLEELAEKHRQYFPHVSLPRFISEKLNDHPYNQDHIIQNELGPYAALETHGYNKSTAIRYPIEQYKHIQTAIEDGSKLVSCINMVKGKKEMATTDELWPDREPGVKSKRGLYVSDIVDLIKGSRYCDIVARWFILNHVGQASEYVTSVTLWLYALDIEPSTWCILLASGVLKLDEDTWVEGAKAVHDKWRKHGCGPTVSDKEWTQLLYMQSLYGRGGVNVNWQEEFRSKATPPQNIVAYNGATWSAEYATQIIKHEIRSAVSTAYPSAKPRAFDDFMNDAYEWLVSGSSAGMPSALKAQHSPVRDYIIHDLQLSPRPTKRSVMEAIPRSKVLEILKTEPKIVAKSHMKLNETGGKARAIYGVTIWHYIFSNWITAPLEKHLNHPSIDINLPNHKYIAQIMARANGSRSGKYYSSYDYPDFNSMHTHEHMAEIYRAAQSNIAILVEHGNYMNREDSDTIISCCDWLIRSTYAQCVIHPITGDVVQTVGGLYSGNRDTTLINTLMNIAYAKVVDISAKNLGLNIGLTSRLCHGDDIISEHSTYSGSQLWNEVAGKCNLRGQEKKLMTDSTYHEYLRIMGTKDGQLRGCLARTCATFVNGNWETETVGGFDNKIAEVFSTLGVLGRRGMRPEKLTKLWRAAFHRISLNFKWGISTETRAWEKISGKTIEDPRTKEDKQRVKKARQRAQRLNIDYSKMPDEVTGPYLAKMESKLPGWVDISKQERSRMKNRLQESTYGTELPIKYQDVEGSAEDTIQSLKSRRPNWEDVRHNVDEGNDAVKLAFKTASRRVENVQADWRIRNHIRAYNILISTIKVPEGYSKYDLLGHLTGFPPEMIRQVLKCDNRATRFASERATQYSAELLSYLNQVNWATAAANTDNQVCVDLTTHTEDYANVNLSDIMKY